MRCAVQGHILVGLLLEALGGPPLAGSFARGGYRSKW